jgi:hypothetical protein
MSNAATTVGGAAAAAPTELGWKFIRGALGLFITGFVVGFVPIAHYMVGGLGGAVGPDFQRTITLWWGCPAILAELTLKTGSLGMIAIGLCYLALARQSASPNISRHEHIAPTLWSYGLIATLVSAGAGYVICNIFWPNFYFHAVPTGKERVARGAGTLHSRLCGRPLLRGRRGRPGRRLNGNDTRSCEGGCEKKDLASNRLDLRNRSRRVLGLFGYADDLPLSGIYELKMKFPILGLALTCSAMGDA